jgi:hypothetical protein
LIYHPDMAISLLLAAALGAAPRHMTLNSPGMMPGGRAHMMYVDSAAKVVYILQTSGPADSEVVFGPLPPVDCPKE